VDLGLESDLNVEVEIQSEAERVALAAAATLLGGLAGNTAKCVRYTADEAAGCLTNIAELEVVEGPLSALLLLLHLLLALAASSLRGSIILLRLLALRLVDLLPLLLPLGPL